MPLRLNDRARREPLFLALGLWAVALFTNEVFVLWLGGHPFFAIAPIVWALHGLVLTWPLYWLIRSTERSPRLVRWTSIPLMIVVLTFVQTALDSWISQWMLLNWSPPGAQTFALLAKISDRPLQTIGFEITLMIYFWVFGFYAVALSLLLMQRRAQEAAEEARRAKLAALRLQMNPHFLFNALNTVSSLVVTGRAAEAEAATLNLADFLHASLVSDGTGLVPLSDELATVEAYLRVEEIRFGERLIVDVDVPDDLIERPVPDFLLQPLVENAVKYAVAPANRPVTIRIEARREGEQLRLIVADDGEPRPASPARKGGGVGLGNTRERLRAFYGADARLETQQEPTGFRATIILPLASPEAATASSVALR